MERHPRRAPILLLQEMKPDRESAGPSCAGGSVVSLNAPSGAQLGLESLQPPWPRAPGLSLAGSNNPDPAAFLLHHPGEFSSPRRDFVEYPQVATGTDLE